jgi:hypothetical protein
MKYTDLPEEIKIRLREPLICDREIEVITKFSAERNGCSYTPYIRARDQAIRMKLASCGCYENFPSAITSPSSDIRKDTEYPRWEDIKSKYKDQILGVILSEDFKLGDSYLILFKEK